jgi:hypothetical protein
MDEPSPDEQEAAMRWLAQGLVPYVAAVASDDANIASGVLVAYESRYFVLTVAHVLRRIKDRRTVRFLCAGRTFAGGPEGMISYNFAQSGEDYPNGIPKPDIGVVELRRSFAEGFVGVQWVTADRISFEGAAHGREIAFIGFPRDRVQGLLPVVRQITLGPTLFRTELRGNRPLPEEERYLDERFDFLAAVPNMVDGSPAPIADDFAEDLQGVCGAGIFLLPAEEEAGWSPTRAQLIGIQRGVLRPSRRFVCHNALWVRAALDQYLRDRPPEWPS